MALINRLSQLLRADLHAVLDRIEEPGLLLRQAIREMEESLAENERNLSHMRKRRSQDGARMDALDRVLTSIESELDVCLSEGNEELARTLVRRKLETAQGRRLLDRKDAELSDRIADLTSTVTEHRRQLECMRQKAELLIDKAPIEERTEPWNTPDFFVTSSDVEIALLHERQRRDQS